MNYNNIPEELRKLKRWCLWRKKVVDGGRTTKTPINANTGFGAKSNDSSTWTSFERAKDSIDLYNCDGLGFMLGDGYFGIDIDHAIENKDLINEFIDTMKSYTEKSQSGTGIHIICKGTLPKGARRKGNIEMYDSLRFFVMTGDSIGNYVIQNATESVKPLWEKYLNQKQEAPKGSYVVTRDYISAEFKAPVFLSDDEVIKLALESKNRALFSTLQNGNWEGAYPSQSEADAAFCSLLAFWTNRNLDQMDRIFRKSGLMREKWDRKTGDSTYGAIQLNKALELVKSGYTPSSKNNIGTFDVATGVVVGGKKYSLDDTGNAQRFVDKFGDIVKYNNTNKWWMIWDGKTWNRDEKQLIKVKADLLIEDMKKELPYITDNKDLQSAVNNIKHLSNNNGKEAMLKEVQHMGNIPVLNKEFNQDIYLLNCENGVVDLKTGELMPHKKEYMMSKNTHIVVDYDNEPKLWIETLNDIFEGSSNMVDYIQKALGYSLTGSTKEQCLFQCYGTGANGKTMFFNIISNILGDYAKTIKISSILAKSYNNGSNASPDIAGMEGARFIKTEEPKENSKVDEGLIKELTGGGSITARHLYAEDFEFRPIFKLWLCCNYKLVIRGTDDGQWRRQRVIPFEAKFKGEKCDKNREEKLMKELPQILAWCIKGAERYFKEGLESPREVVEATEEYKVEMDIIESFMKEECILNKKERISAKEIFDAYKNWAKNGNEYLMSQTKFGMEMSKKFTKKREGSKTVYCGITLIRYNKSYVVEAEEEEDDK